MKVAYCFCAAIAAASLVGPSMDAATSANFDFESDTPGSVPTGWTGDTTADRTTAVREDTTELFNNGTGNQYLELTDNSGSEIFEAFTPFTVNAGDVFTLSFLAIETAAPNDGGNGGIAFGDGGLASFSSNRVFDIGDSDLGVNRDDLHRVFILANNSGSGQSFFNPVDNVDQTLAAGATEAFGYNYVDQQYRRLSVGTNLNKSFADIDRFGWTVGTTSRSSILIDDVQTQAGLTAVIPEPASIILLSFGSLLVVGRRRR